MSTVICRPTGRRAPSAITDFTSRSHCNADVNFLQRQCKRAGIATTPELSEHASVFERIHAEQQRN
jgi:hypothetical protein